MPKIEYEAMPELDKETRLYGNETQGHRITQLEFQVGELAIELHKLKKTLLLNQTIDKL